VPRASALIGPALRGAEAKLYRATRRRARRSVQLVVLSLWALVLLSMPYYLFSSGQPQLSDYLLCAVSAIVFLGMRLDQRVRPAILALMAFVAYVAMVNALWAAVLRDEFFLVATLFYVFNLLVVTTALVLFSHYRESFLTVTYFATTISLFVTAAIGVLQGGAARGMIFFETPNQLAYYSLSATTIGVVLSQYRRASRLYAGAVIVAGLYLQYVSVSRAGAVSMLALLGAIVVRRPAAILTGTVVLVGALLFFESESERVNLWQMRIDTTQSETIADHLQERGVDRLVENPHHMLVGAGEGGYRRFGPVAKELHSSLLTVLFCYGLVGLLLFGRLLWRVWKTTGSRVSIFLVPLLLFGFTHQGLRFRGFWLAIVVCVAVALMVEDRRRSPRTARA
jgi:hypothetical protein